MITCFSRGPRIGEDDMPYCKREAGHEGWHFPDPEDGWESYLVWGEPSLINLALRRLEALEMPAPLAVRARHWSGEFRDSPL